MRDLEFVQSEILLYVLIGLSALLIFLVVKLRSDICKSKKMTALNPEEKSRMHDGVAVHASCFIFSEQIANELHHTTCITSAHEIQ